jgi:hypothetical protein
MDMMTDKNIYIKRRKMKIKLGKDWVIKTFDYLNLILGWSNLFSSFRNLRNIFYFLCVRLRNFYIGITF